MEKILKNPINKFLLWIVMGLFVCIIGVTNVFADTYSYNQFTAQLYDNYAPTLSAVTTDQTNGRWQGAIPTMTANSAGAAWGISSNMVLLANHTYTLTAQITGTYGGRLVLSTYNRIGVGTTLANAKTSYQNNSNVNENYSRVLDDGYTIQFAFTPTINGSYIVFAFATNYTGSNQYFYLSNYTIEDLGSSGGVSESTINNSLNSQTNVLNQSITNSQNAIIQNQNENNEALIESNQELLGNCIKNYMTSSDIVNTYNLWQEGNNFQQQTADTASSLALVVHSYNNGSFVDVLNTTTINSTGIYKLSFTKTSSFNQIMFKLNGATIDTGILINISNLQNNTTYYISSDFFNITQGNIRFKNVMITDTNTTTFVSWGDTKCTSKLDDTNNAINGVNDTLNDNSIDTSDATSFFDNFTDNTHGLSGIISAPLNAINAMLSNQCTPLTATWKNKTISLPCGYEMWTKFSSFKDFLNIVLDGLICYRLLLKLFKLVERFKNPNDDRVEVMDL